MTEEDHLALGELTLVYVQGYPGFLKFLQQGMETNIMSLGLCPRPAGRRCGTPHLQVHQ